MSLRTFTRAFPTQTNYGLNLFDQTPVNLNGGGNAPVGGGYSGGAMAVTTVEQPTAVSRWRIIGWGLSFQASLLGIDAVGVMPFARLGKLYGGLVRNAGLTEQPGFIPFSGLPPDHSMIELLWDGQNDPPFPQASSSTPFVPGAPSMENKSVTLPIPLDAEQDDRLQIGFWLTPMLGQNTRVWVFNAGYSIVYDDNPQ